MAVGLGAQEHSMAAPDQAERAWIASKMYSVLQANFAHWEAVPDLDLDSRYREYLQDAVAAQGRRDFSLASMRFLASLGNGHTNFYDDSLRYWEGHSTGFSLVRLGDRWVVAQTVLEGLARGDVVIAIDGRPFDDFFADRGRYISVSSEAARVRHLFYNPYLFPPTFTLGLDDGRTLEIERKRKQRSAKQPPKPMEAGLLEEGVFYLPIRSFGKPEIEKAAIETIRQNREVSTLIIDVRGNGGGTTPTQLIEALMDRPWRGWTSATPQVTGLESAYAHLAKTLDDGKMSERIRGYLDAYQGADRRMLFTAGSVNQPRDPLFTNRLIVLVDERCASACEGFVMPLRVSGRATLVGRATGGSSGQPYLYDFGNGMRFRVSTKRMYFPDGSQFEGVGVAPHVLVPLTVETLRSPADEDLNRALRLARGQ